MESTELMHYGVKGMKWGVRKKYYNSDGSLNDRGVEKYAKKGYAKDSFRSNKTTAGKAWDAYTGAHKINAAAKYETSSKKQNQERAEKYLADRKSDRKKAAKNIAKKAGKGAAAVAGSLAKVGQAYATDQLFFGGYGTAAAKEAIRGVGMAAITAYTMARGGYDIKWFDKQGRRVG